MRRKWILLGALCVFCMPATAQANWGPSNECGVKAEPKNEHCYALSERNTAAYGGVLASIDFVDTDYNSYPIVSVPAGGFVTNEEWISFESQGVTGWIETGQAMGDPYDSSNQESVEVHPFYAEERSNGEYHEYLSPSTLPAGGPAFEKSEPYNHYVLFDSEKNGRWHIYWGCCEVGYYGGGWPVYLTEQEAGIEAATSSRPYEYGREEVADSDGGAWTPWEHDTWFNGDKGICLEANEEDHNEGDVEWGTNCDL
jgi:hypothetical protein